MNKAVLINIELILTAAVFDMKLYGYKVFTVSNGAFVIAYVQVKKAVFKIGITAVLTRVSSGGRIYTLFGGPDRLAVKFLA